MKTKEIRTWLPCFSGFYNTIWEPDTESEIYSLNQERTAKGLPEITFDDCEFDYQDYENQVVNSIAKYLTKRLSKFVQSIEVEQIVRPKWYNFTNDSCNVKIKLSIVNRGNILRYLDLNKETFAEYLTKYKSRDGFISFYPHEIEAFMTDNPLEHQHKLGSILEFIADNIGIDTEDLYYNVEAYLSITNYNELAA